MVSSSLFHSKKINNNKDKPTKFFIHFGISPNRFKTSPHKTCTWMFIAALFIISKTWKNLKCLPVAEQISKLWHVQTIEYHSVLEISGL
jgi:hypothetical protein